MDFLIGVDIGTYESKGALTTLDGKLIQKAVRPHKLSVPRPGWAEHDAEKTWWVDFCEIIHELLDHSGVFPSQIAAVGVSAIGPTVLPVDKAGRALRPAILYGIDTRSVAEIDELNKELGAETVFEQCGKYLTTQSAGPKIRWLQKHEPEIYQKADKFVTATTFLVQRLTGNCVIDHYTAAAGYTPLYNLKEQRWDPEFCRAIVEMERLPEPKWTTDIAGVITHDASAACGLCTGTPVIVGTCDASAEAVSVGVVHPGQTMMMYGSTVFLIRVTSENLSDQRLWSAPYLFPGTYSLLGGMATTGAITRWIKDQFAKELDFEEISQGKNVYDILTKEAERTPPGADGLVLLPYFSGERTPLNDPMARGVIFGLTLAHTRGHVFRAVLEGVGFGIRSHLDIMREKGLEAGELTAVGGGAKNLLWLQVVSDICKAPQRVNDVALGASYGDAFLAGLGVGAVPNYKEIDRWVKVKHIVQPQAGNADLYDRLSRIYSGLYHSSREWMHEISRIQNGEFEA